MIVTPETLMAFVDGELNEIEHTRVARAVDADPALAAELATHRALKAQLSAHFDTIVDAPVPDRLTAMLARDVTVVDFARAKAVHASRQWLPRWGAVAAIAASLVLGVGIGTQVPDSGPIASQDGSLVAQGRLARALDTQLASTQGDAPIRILVSFRNRDGTLCRGFNGEELTGIACRDTSNWVVRQAQSAAPQSAGAYRQAGAGDAAIMAAAQDMAAGEPFDAGAELRARDSGWKG